MNCTSCKREMPKYNIRIACRRCECGSTAFEGRFSNPVGVLTQADIDAAVAAERERWRGFTAHCLRVVASLKAQMTAEQVVAHLDAEMDKSIARMMSSDNSDLDPDLVEWASRVLWPTVASSGTSEPVLP